MKNKINEIKKIYEEVENKIYEYLRSNNLNKIKAVNEYEEMIKYQGMVEALNLILQILKKGD